MFSPFGKIDFWKAAVHFTQYLCATNKVSSGSPSISREDLKKIFTEEYQPYYNVQCLELKTLIHTLTMAGFLVKHTSNGNPCVTFKWNRVEQAALTNGHLPEKPPSRLTKPKPRLIVSQRYTQIRENQDRPDGITDEKCDLCKVILSPHTAQEHKETEIHTLRVAYRTKKKSFDDTKHFLSVQMCDKDSAEEPLIGDLKKSCRVGSKYDLNLLVTNLFDDKEIFIEKILQLMPNKDIKLENIEAETLLPGKPKTVGIQAQFSARGAIIFPLIFKMLPSGSALPKYYLKEIYFLTQSELMDQLAPSEPFRPSMGPVVKVQDAPIIPGKPAEFTQASELKETLAIFKRPFEIPPVLLRFLNNGFKEHANMSPAEKKNLQTIRAMLPQGNSADALTPDNYAQLLELLLFIEEHQMSRDIHYYDMHDAVLFKDPMGLWLEVPGLVDKRPSLLINDVLHVSFCEDQGKRKYEGHVHQIQGSQVLLGLNDAFFNKYSNQKLEIQFNINRRALKNMHIALYLISCNKAQHLLFPSLKTKPLCQPPLRPWFNRAIEKNPEQQAAVRNVVHNSSQNSPYLIFGPPGTGKTVTLVETILQLWKPPSNQTRILVCTPSNSAADEITSRILRVIYDHNLVPATRVKDHIFRMCAYSRPWNLMPKIIQDAEITNHDLRGGVVTFPRKEVIMTYDIVIVHSHVHPDWFLHSFLLITLPTSSWMRLGRLWRQRP
ncbi:putative helicase mov-10-B.1 isoform X2 [Thrips palmi]|uniref:Helicase mov-10-B.1 isoform X2 n=1 Tax=Thrips palmi TaxID=161013 RepID=A0A6P8YZM0_THRPL|nr:putative helicase mov-10-B.1 isoform X2 [Thrips palmi]